MACAEPSAADASRSLLPEARFPFPWLERLNRLRLSASRGRLSNVLALLVSVSLGRLPQIAHAEYQVLFIGNSFTIGSGGGGVPGIFDRLAQAGGQPDPTTVMQAVGGVDFQYHSQDATTQAAIRSRPWTHVILQNYSTQPTHLGDGVQGIANHMTYGALH